MDFDLFSQPEPKRAMHENSIECYKEKVLPTLSGRRLQVLNAIKELGGEADSWQVAQLLNRPLHTISGRFTDLSSEKWKAIEDTGRNNKHHNSNFTIWKICNTQNF